MSEQTPPTPLPTSVIESVFAHMGARQLQTAQRHGLFRELAAGPRTAGQLAEALALPERTTRMLADAMNALGYLDRVDGAYTNSAEAAAYLAGDRSTVFDITPLVGFVEELGYPHWQNFDQSVRTDSSGELDVSGERWDVFLSGVMNFNALHATVLGRIHDFSRYRRMLDLGGLCEHFTLAALAAHPELTVDAVFEPDFVPALTAAVTEHGVTDRVTVTASPATSAAVEGGHDVVLLAHVIHRYTAAENLEILRVARAAALDGATLLVLDFVLDDAERQRRLDAMIAGEYLVVDGTRVHPVGDVTAWLEKTGWTLTDTVDVPGSPRLLIARAH